MKLFLLLLLSLPIIFLILLMYSNYNKLKKNRDIALKRKKNLMDKKL